ncbi:MAG TPA: hypothetical protein VGM73_07930 [Candidatus Didemnitutus sp.]|jgi:hypothetical protein
MNFRFRLSSSAWIFVLFAACGYLLWTGCVRARHAQYVTGLARDELMVDAASPTGFSGGMRSLMVPAGNERSCRWIIQTQLMLAHDDWRIRHVDYDNAPYGHEVNAASPFRWWLGGIAWLDHETSGRPIGFSVERAALYGGPLLHLLLLVGGTIFVAWRFGPLAAAFFAPGLAAIFPLAAEYVPGLPDDNGLAQLCALGSVLLLMAGVSSLATSPSGPVSAGLRPTGAGYRWFFSAGVAGAAGLWINVSVQAPILAGLALGGLMAAWVGRGQSVLEGLAPAWRAWATGGALASLGAYLIEYFPAHLGSWQLRAVHPLYGLAWLGGGEVLFQLTAWIRNEPRRRNPSGLVLAFLGLAALAALPVFMWKTRQAGFLAVDLFSSRLSKLPGSPVAASLWAWLLHDGISAAIGILFLPLLIVPPAVALLWSNRWTSPGFRVMLIIALGPVLVALGFACRELSWWNGLDGMLLVLLVVVTAALGERARPRYVRWAWAATVGLIVAVGGSQLMPRFGETKGPLNESEVRSLVERDLAHWLSRQVGPEGAVVLAPLELTTSLYYYGGLRGLATLDEENHDGLIGAVRLVSATTAEEALELAHRRGITHIVIPSWDRQLDEDARLGLGQVEGSLIGRLHQWALPPWLRPIPYQLPSITGFEGQSVAVLEVVDEQDDAVALSQLAEYFIEMGQIDHAVAVGRLLRRFPSDPGALAALFEVELAAQDEVASAQTLESLLARLDRKADRNMPWDRRVSLALALAHARRIDAARAQVRRCLEGIDEAKLRFLSTGSLYRLLVLGKAFGLPIADEHLRAIALRLLPVDLRAHFQQ